MGYYQPTLYSTAFYLICVYLLHIFHYISKNNYLYINDNWIFTHPDLSNLIPYSHISIHYPYRLLFNIFLIYFSEMLKRMVLILCIPKRTIPTIPELLIRNRILLLQYFNHHNKVSYHRYLIIMFFSLFYLLPNLVYIVIFILSTGLLLY